MLNDVNIRMFHKQYILKWPWCWSTRLSPLAAGKHGYVAVFCYIENCWALYMEIFLFCQTEQHFIFVLLEPCVCSLSSFRLVTCSLLHVDSWKSSLFLTYLKRWMFVSVQVATCATHQRFPLDNLCNTEKKNRGRVSLCPGASICVSGQIFFKFNKRGLTENCLTVPVWTVIESFSLFKAPSGPFNIIIHLSNSIIRLQVTLVTSLTHLHQIVLYVSNHKPAW
jgi:hypothetical protein